MGIQLLDGLVANQIAAGEVVDRPASIVKELLENSLDAGATNIVIELEEGGNKSISITDNGTGIDKEDLILAPLRHATSKIVTSEDLIGVKSLGFRGEALASIAAVSRFSITSKHRDSNDAYSIEFTGYTENPELKLASLPKGTCVKIKDIFCTMPVRRKFLRTSKTEYNYIEDIVKRISLSNYSCAFTLIHNNKLIFKLPITENENLERLRIVKMFGSKFINNSFSINKNAIGYSLTGYLGNNKVQKRSSELQFFYLNGRSVKDKVINHAIRQALQEYLPVGDFPCYVLYLNVDPKSVDVNVHPTKNEVRFVDSRSVHDFISLSIEEAINSNIFKHTIQEYKSPYKADVDIGVKEEEPSSIYGNEPYKAAQKESSLFSTKKFYNDVLTNDVIISHDTSEEKTIVKKESTSAEVFFKVILKLYDRYFIMEKERSFYMLDFHRFITCYVRFLCSEKKVLLSNVKKLLFPSLVSFNSNEFELIENKLSLLSEIGVDCKVTGKNTIAVTSMPVFFDIDKLKELVLCVSRFVCIEDLLKKDSMLFSFIDINNYLDKSDNDISVIINSNYSSIELSDTKVLSILSEEKIEKLFFKDKS